MDNLKNGRLRDVYVSVILFLLVLAGGVIAAQVGPTYLTVAVTTGNTAPVVSNGTNGTVTLTDGGKTQFTVNFNVTDADGTANINNAAVGVNITFNGIKRSNNTGNCVVLGNPTSTVRSFSCIVVFNYFDNASALWEINMSAEDNAGGKAHNDSQSAGNPAGGAGHNVSTTSLSAFTLQTPNVVSSANLGDTNKELSFVVNNTGNFDFTVINVTPFNLNASLTDIFALNGNFSINATVSGSGFGDNLQNATPRNITDSALLSNVSATLPHKITGGEADNLGNRTLYIYIDVPSTKGLSSGVTYNSSRAWELFTS